MPKVFTSNRQKIGKLGEEIALRHFLNAKHRLLGENITFKHGEIDLLTIDKSKKIHFIEVKSVRVDFSISKSHDTYRPQDNMSEQKMEKMKRTIDGILSFRENVLYEQIEREVGEGTTVTWQVDLALVYIDTKNKKAKVEVVWDIIL